MGENGGTNFTNWGLLPTQMTHFSSHLDLQLMSSTQENALYGGGGSAPLQLSLPQQQQQLIHQLRPSSSMDASMIGGPYHHHRIGLISDASVPTNYVWDGIGSLSHRREKILNILPDHQHQQSELDYGVMPVSSFAHPVQYIQQEHLWKNDSTNTDRVQVCEETDAMRLANKRGSTGGKAPKSTKAKKQKMEECTPRVANRARGTKKSAEVIINGISMDISGIPVPVCTCTGTPQQCYRWGAGGWQSACCTTSLSKYPLPMSPKRRGARIPGRKMSFGAFRKVLEKVASEGYDISSPIDLVTHWAKHGTNKFVTIR